MGHIILVRHGESRWNVDNKFTGWVDVPLTEVGIHEALIAAEKLNDINIDVAFTSKLMRANETLVLILAHQKKTGIFLHESKQRKAWSMHNHGKEFEENEIPIYSSTKLNERYYGKLQGLNKDMARKKWGEEQVHNWRRSYDVRPPGGESLKDVYKRAVPYFKKHILPEVQKGKNVIIAAHGNSLRALIKHIELISDTDIPNLELQLGTPIIYRWHRKKLVKINHAHNFNRPTHWEHSPRHKRSYSQAKATSKKKVIKENTITKRRTITKKTNSKEHEKSRNKK
ncbi:histidine phosphatase family protein [Candidatus Woesearchaeota archaeon]|nr:histidine phosphatase family protein [Candidatus Woesearchaeota archaeon]